MGLYTIGLQQQQQSSSAGLRGYPQITGITINSIFSDSFNRSSLNPTNAYELYSTVADNSGTVTMFSENQVKMLTGTTIGNHAVIRTDELSFELGGISPDTKSGMTFTILVQLEQTADTEFYAGIVDIGTDLLTLPASGQRHMGIRLDRSASANWFFTHANGTDLVTADTAIAASTTTGTLVIEWRGTNDATMTFTVGTSSATETVTAYGTAISNFTALTQTEGAAAKGGRISGWSVEAF